MFTRAPQVAHICLRCQEGLAQRASLKAAQNSTRLSRRWQSHAVARIYDENDIAEPTQPPVSNDPFNALSLRRQHIRKSKSWRPSVDLGMNALGRPAEVLILPSKDRRIPSVPSEADQNPSEEIHESLASEKTPLSWEQLKENIHQIRCNLDNTRGQLEVEQWKALRRSLRKGFTRNQLRKYIEEKQDQISEVAKLKSLKTADKLHLIEIMARELWGYHLPGSLTSDKTTTSTKENKIKAKLDKQQIEVLLRDLNQPLKQIADGSNVKIDVFQDHGHITISGEAESIRAARMKVSRLKKSIKTSEIKLQETLQQIHTQGQSISPLLQNLASKYGVVVMKTSKEQVQVKHLDTGSISVDSIRRELQLAIPPVQKQNQCGIWPDAIAQDSSLMPFETTNSMKWMQRSRPFGRLLSYVNDPDSQTSFQSTLESQQPAYQSLVKTLVKWSKNDSLMKPAKFPNGIHQVLYATFGQSLFKRSRSSSANMTGKDINKYPQQIFVEEVPYLPQFLRTLKAADVDRGKLTNPEVEGLSPFTMRVIISPTAQDTALPSFELFFRGEDGKLQLKQPLQIARVSAIHEESSFTVLMPSKPIDVEFTSQIKQDLFATHSKSSTRHHAILQSLSAYLTRAQDQSDFEPFLNLDVPLGLLHPFRLTEIESNTPKHSPQSYEYMLISAEKVEADIRGAPDKSNFTISHIHYSGGQQGHDKQEVRLDKDPLLCAPTDPKFDFSAFIYTALDTVYSISEHAERLGKQSIDQMT